MTAFNKQHYAPQDFNVNGFCIYPNWLNEKSLLAMRLAAAGELENAQPPLELEAELGYPFAPTSTQAQGGQTPRRLLQAYARNPLFKEFAACSKLKGVMQRLLPAEEVMLTQSHHNCIMTKLPAFSSDTGWHQDYRYWSFDSPNLVTAWLALSYENSYNGGLKVVPGSHVLALDADRFCDEKFLKTDNPDNKKILDDAITLHLKPGDLLCFHANLLHAASRNNSIEPKIALVFTYHAKHNRPIPNTRSTAYPSVVIG